MGICAGMCTDMSSVVHAVSVVQVCTEACRREVREVWIAKLAACVGVSLAEMPCV